MELKRGDRRLSRWIDQRMKQMSERIYESSWYQRMFLGKGNQKEYLRRLYPGERLEHVLKAYHCRKIKTLCSGLGMAILLLLAGVLWYFRQQEHLIETWIHRPEYYEGSRAERWNVERSDGTKATVELDISEREYTKEEAQEQLSKAMEYLDTVILGENEAADRVEAALYLPEQIQDTGITVTWFSNCPDIVTSEGEIPDDYAEESGTLVEIRGVLQCQSYEAYYIRNFLVFPRKREGLDAFAAEVINALKVQEEQSGKERGFYLPQTINGQSVTFRKEGGYEFLMLGALSVLAAVLLFVNQDEKLEQEAKKREQQLLADYPELVSKLTVLMRAGLAARLAFGKISGDYQRRKETDGVFRYAYEELLITCREMDNGIPEEQAYENYGKRCGILPYMRLGGLLTQNLRRGSNRLLDMLNQEALEAFEERKRRAKKAGEEAGTKMLMPMVLMLVVTIVIILYPAFTSFQL